MRSFNSFINISYFYIGFTLFPLVAAYFIKKKYARKKELLVKTQNEILDNYYYQCIFIDEKNFNCRQHIIDKMECDTFCSRNHLMTLQKFIGSATKSISMCVLTLKLLNLVDELVEAHERGIKVRIILDQEMIPITCKRYKRLKFNDVPVKTQHNDGSYVHHKFCLIDAEDKTKAKVFFGSLNLTLQGIAKNYENCILTNNSHIIERFSEEFEELWDFFPYCTK